MLEFVGVFTGAISSEIDGSFDRPHIQRLEDFRMVTCGHVDGRKRRCTSNVGADQRVNGDDSGVGELAVAEIVRALARMRVVVGVA